MAAASSVRSILQRQASTMEAMRASFQRSQPTVLFPDFTGEDYSALEMTVLALIPAKLAELADIERAVEVASADPESRKLVARITERLPSRAQVAQLTPWAVFVVVALDMLHVAPEINPNDIGVLTMILMVVLYLLPPRSVLDRLSVAKTESLLGLKRSWTRSDAVLRCQHHSAC